MDMQKSHRHHSSSRSERGPLVWKTCGFARGRLAISHAKLWDFISSCTIRGKFKKVLLIMNSILGDNMDAKDAAIAAKKYFEDTKSLIKFIFETVSVRKEGENWVVICLVQDLFEDEGKKFKIIVGNEEEILDVEKIDQSPR